MKWLVNVYVCGKVFVCTHVLRTFESDVCDIFIARPKYFLFDCSLEVSKKIEGLMDAPPQLFLKVIFTSSKENYQHGEAYPFLTDHTVFVNFLYYQVKDVDQSGEWFKDGMKLEAIDPLNLSAICVGTVRKVMAYSQIGVMHKL